MLLIQMQRERQLQEEEERRLRDEDEQRRKREERERYQRELAELEEKEAMLKELESKAVSIVLDRKGLTDPDIGFEDPAFENPNVYLTFDGVTLEKLEKRTPETSKPLLASDQELTKGNTPEAVSMLLPATIPADEEMAPQV